jgi:small-conductance mechanosensitive channel
MSDKVLTAAFWIEFWHDTAKDIVHGAVRVIGILAAYIVIRTICYRIIDGLLTRLLKQDSKFAVTEERVGRLQTLQGLTKSVVGYVLFFVLGVLLLGAVGIPILPFITSASVVGIAVGLGAQKLFKDVISGFFIVVDNMYTIGETVTIGTITGEVQELGMRVTRLLDSSGKTHLISNGDIGTVTNLSRHAILDFVEVNVGAAADLNQVVEVSNKAGDAVFATEDHRLKTAPYVLGITAFTAASVTIRMTVVTEPAYLALEQMRVRAALRAAYAKAEIPIA